MSIPIAMIAPIIRIFFTVFLSPHKQQDAPCDYLTFTSRKDASALT